MTNKSPQATEIELKYRLHSHAELDRVAAALLQNAGNIEDLHQVNYFFDSAGHHLRKNKLALRLRQQNDVFILSAKSPLPGGKDKSQKLAVRIEHEMQVPSAIAHDMLSNPILALEYLATGQLEHKRKDEERRVFLYRAIARELGKEHLVLLGSFTNRRRCIPVLIDKQQYLAELDETNFANETHYEVELEVPSEKHVKNVDAFLTALFARLEITTFSSRGKADRFYESLLRRR